MKSISLTLNGRQITSTCEVHETLRTFLRSQGMFSVHYGSDSGETGAGAVLLNGELVSSDVVLAVQADGHSITTVEALNTEAELHPIQAAFVAAGAFQSGYSAGAMVLGTLALLEENPAPTDAQIRDMLSGILDRETAYVKPVEAIHRAGGPSRSPEGMPRHSMPWCALPMSPRRPPPRLARRCRRPSRRNLPCRGAVQRGAHTISVAAGGSPFWKALGEVAFRDEEHANHSQPTASAQLC